jgi:uncharacterized protein
MPTTEERLSITTPRAEVSAALAAPAGAVAMMVVAHGAGGDMGSAFLRGFTGAMNEERIATMRFNFPYAELGRRSPDGEPALRQTWRAAVDVARERSALGLVCGGKSLGGRIASLCVADGEIDAAGLVFLGYPLHPPGAPERVRDEHLYRIGVSMLFLQGTADPFARPEVLGPVLRRLGARAEHDAIERGDHSFRVRGARLDDGEIGASLAPAAAAFVRRVTGH